VNTESVDREHVLSAIEEYDQLGDEVFLRRYGFSRTNANLFWYDGRSYESQAVLGVAMKHATGKAERPPAFNGSTDAAKILESLDFEIITISDELGPPDESIGPWQMASDVGADEARTAWAAVARDVLLQTAKRYGAMVTTKELSTLVQTRTGIRTRQQVHYWIGDVLGRVANDCAQRGEPLLSSLCVDTSGSVGKSYAGIVETLRGETVPDGDDHAATERLACHRHFGAEMPEDGGIATLTPSLVAARARLRAKKAPIRPALICPRCNMALLPTGECDNCG